MSANVVDLSFLSKHGMTLTSSTINLIVSDSEIDRIMLETPNQNSSMEDVPENDQHESFAIEESITTNDIEEIVDIDESENYEKQNGEVSFFNHNFFRK